MDDETAWIIKKMFKLAREGWGTQRIKTEFERDKIPTPSWWNRERGLRNYYKRFEDDNIDDGSYVWNVTTIKKMLTKPAYIGSIASQRSICAFKLGWMGYRSPEEWIVVENTHEALVDIET